MEHDIEKILITREQIENKARELGEMLKKDYEGKNPILLGILKGSVMFMADLMKHLDFSLEVDFMDVSSYYGTESTGIVKVKKDIDQDPKDRHIIIVEDIIDTGQTLYKIQNVLKERGAISVEIITLLDKPEARITNMKAKYVGFEIPKLFVVGYGLDYNEKYRNLPYVGILKECVYK
ncbi:MAG: hypoxanthine phosphoribosyltransferase [Defluviitaleaceae bacterium]|nr:hypoxanthine phosphoribosyltransferase [Defluviitaleaceae bacterium]